VPSSGWGFSATVKPRLSRQKEKGVSCNSDFNSDKSREDHRFVVHLWRERSAGEPRWRGTVYEVSSALGIASCKLLDLWDFIMLRLNQSGE
jgi:hypothetical protein